MRSAFPLESLSQILFTSLVVILVFILFSKRQNSLYRRLGILAIIGHIAIALAIPSGTWTWDIAKFHEAALGVLEGASQFETTTVWTFAKFQALLYTVFGPSTIVVSIVNGLFAVLIPIPAVDITRHLYPQLKSTNALVTTILFLPLPFLYLTIPMRDALGVLLFFTVLAAAVRLLTTGEWLPLILTVPLSLYMRLIRPELSTIFLIGIVAAIAIELLNRLTKRPLSIRRLFVPALATGLLALPLIGPRLPVENMAQELAKRTGGGAVYLEGMTYTDWTDIVVAAPIRSLYFQYAPFPLQVTRVIDLVPFAMLPVLLIVTIGAIRSLRQCDPQFVATSFLLTVYFIGIAGYGLINTNYGTTFRHRIPFTFLLCIFAAPVFEQWEQSLRERIGY